MTRAEMLQRISSRELTGWMAYEHAFGPLGGARGDHQAGQIVAAVVNMLRDPKKSRPVKVEDVRLRWPGEADPEVDVEDQAVVVQQLAATLGGEITIGDDR